MTDTHSKFHYSSYWGSWSRVLSEEEAWYVEVNLTPISNCLNSTWERVGEIIIRRHGTARSRGDINTNTLPDNVLSDMTKHLGKETAIYLLGADFLPEIDWDLYEKHHNGGCSLHKCLKEGVGV